MTIKTNSPAPHAGETGAPAIPKDRKTPGMGEPAQQSDAELADDERPQADPETPALGGWDTRRGRGPQQPAVDLPPRDPRAADSGLENLIAPTDPGSMSRAEDDDIVFAGSHEFHDRPGQGAGPSPASETDIKNDEPDALKRRPRRSSGAR
jgi:hypothetical protein